MEIYTIGFGGRTAEQFFEPLKRARVQELVDVRLKNVSQLAGFTKKADLPYLLRQIGGIGYSHELLLAPTAEMLKAYRSKEIEWPEYEDRYRQLLAERQVSEAIAPQRFPDRVAFLCSEPLPDKCHRRVAAEYLQARWPAVSITHL